MKSRLYSVRDIKTGSFDAPFPSVNDETSKRYFAQVILAVPLMSKNPADFELHYVGDFDNDSSRLLPIEACQFVCTGLECVKNIQDNSSDETSKVGDDSPVQSGS